MTYNNNHYTTFVALLKLWGLRADIAELISTQLYCIDNDAQDNLIAVMTEEFYKTQTPQQVERNS